MKFPADLYILILILDVMNIVGKESEHQCMKWIP